MTTRVGGGGTLTLFFAAVVVAAAVLVALLVLVAVAGLVVVGAPVVVALGPRCGEEETKNRRRFQQEVCWTVGRLGGALDSWNLLADTIFGDE